jgi:hypothetical protein
MKNKTLKISAGKLALKGAVIAIACVFFYSQIVMLYVICRSSAFIFSAMGEEERSGILFANGFILAYSVAFISILVAMISSLFGAVAALILNKALSYFNPARGSIRAMFISLVVAILLIFTGFVLIGIFLIPRFEFQYPEAFLFWTVFPSTIYILVNLAGGMVLNKYAVAESLND